MTEETTIIESCGLRVETAGLGWHWRSVLFVLVHLAGPVFWALGWVMWHLGSRE